MAGPGAAVKGLLNFLHNTSPEALARYEQLGGIPAPSIGVTKQDIPFENFGDITLVGKPSLLAPEANKANAMWSSDAYTVRAPRPFRLSAKGASERFADDYKDIDPVYRAEAEYALSELSRKKPSSSPLSMYNNIDNFFFSEGAIRKWAKDTGLEIPKDLKLSEVRQFRESNREAFDSWKAKEIDKYLDPELYFDASSKSSSRASPKPFTNENVVSFMKKSTGSGTEDTAAFGAGKIRASLQPRLQSLEEARQAKGLLSTETLESNTGNDNLLLDLQDSLQQFYSWPDSSWQMRDDVGAAIANSGRLGMRQSLEREGFKDVPDSIVSELESFASQLISSPTQYFESKPMRPVDLSEFGGAIVPMDTPDSTINILQSKGIPVERYASPEERLAARSRFDDTAFVRPEAGLLAAMVAADAQGSGSAMDYLQDQARAGHSQEVDARMRAIGMDPRPEPGYEYGDILPYRRDIETGERELAAPSFIRDAVRGLLDLSATPKTGVYNPQSLFDVMM